MTEAAATPGPSSQGSAAPIDQDDDYSDERFLHIIQVFWDLKLTLQDLRQFKSEVVQEIYICFLKEVGVNIQKYHQIPPQLVDHIQYPDMYSGAVYLSMLTADLRKCFRYIFDDDSFRLVDLFNPRPKRTTNFFSLIYDYLLFSDNVMSEVYKINDQISGLVHDREKMRVRLQKIKEQIHERRTLNEKNELAKEEEMKKCDAKTEELQKCQEEKTTLKAKFDAIAASLNTLDLNIKQKELRIVEASSERKRLEGLVIQPNEEQGINKRDEKLASLKEENRGKKEHLAKLKERLSFLNDCKEKVEKIIPMLHELEQERMKDKELQAKLQQLHSHVTQLHEEIQDQTQENQELTEKLAASETMLHHVHQAWELKRESLNKEIKEQKQVQEEIQRNHTEQDIVAKELSDDVIKLEEQIRQSKEESKNIIRMIENNYKHLLDSLEKDNMSLMASVTNVIRSVENFKKD